MRLLIDIVLLEDLIYFQAKAISAGVVKLVAQMLPVLLNGKLAGEASSRIGSETIAIEVERRSTDTQNVTGMITLDGGHIRLPNLLLVLPNQTSEVDVKVREIFIWCY